MTTRQHSLLAANSNPRFSKVAFHAVANEICLCQSEVTKDYIVEVCKLMKAMSDAIICFISVVCGSVAYSSLWLLNC